jgi:hypothetical protein
MSGWLRRNIIVAREERAFIAVISTKYRVLYIVLLYADNNDKKSVVIQLSTPFTGPKYTKRLHTYTHIIKLNHTNASLLGNNRQFVIQFESNCGQTTSVPFGSAYQQIITCLMFPITV